MTGVNELTGFLMLFLLIGCVVGWIIIGVRIRKCRIEGQCPKDRICKNSECQWCAWCKKHQRYSDTFRYLSEIMREMKKREEAEKSAAS